MRLEKAMHQLTLRVSAVGCIETGQQVLALDRIHQWHVFQYAVFIGDHGFQQSLEIAQVTVHGAFVEQRRGVFQRADQLIANLGHVQHQIELGRVVVYRHALQVHGAERQVGRFVVLPGQHRLEDRAVGHAALRTNHLDHLFERQVLMALRCQRLTLDLLHQRFDARCAGEIDAYRQGVDEEPDQVLHFGPQAVGHRCTDHHIILTGQTPQQRGPCDHHGHEQRAAMPLAQGLEAAGQLGIEHQAANIAAVVLLCRARPVGRQGQQGWCTAQGLLPVLTLLLQHVAAQPVALPHGIVGVLHRQGGQRILGTGTERGIERTQLTSQYIRGPAVGDDMVHGHQQHVIVLGHAHQTSAYQRTVEQIEAFVGFFSGDGEQLLFSIRLPGQHLQLQAETDIGRGYVLCNVLAMHLHEGRTQHFVAGDDTVQRAFQRRVIQSAT